MATIMDSLSQRCAAPPWHQRAGACLAFNLGLKHLALTPNVGSAQTRAWAEFSAPVQQAAGRLLRFADVADVVMLMRGARDRNDDALAQTMERLTTQLEREYRGKVAVGELIGALPAEAQTIYAAEWNALATAGWQTRFVIGNIHGVEAGVTSHRDENSRQIVLRINLLMASALGFTFQLDFITATQWCRSHSVELLGKLGIAADDTVTANNWLSTWIYVDAYTLQIDHYRSLRARALTPPFALYEVLPLPARDVRTRTASSAVVSHRLAAKPQSADITAYLIDHPLATVLDDAPRAAQHG